VPEQQPEVEKVVSRVAGPLQPQLRTGTPGGRHTGITGGPASVGVGPEHLMQDSQPVPPVLQDWTPYSPPPQEQSWIAPGVHMTSRSSSPQPEASRRLTVTKSAMKRIGEFENMKPPFDAVERPSKSFEAGRICQ
jgi:hypothetical protein